MDDQKPDVDVEQEYIVGPNYVRIRHHTKGYWTVTVLPKKTDDPGYPGHTYSSAIGECPNGPDLDAMLAWAKTITVVDHEYQVLFVHLDGSQGDLMYHSSHQIRLDGGPLFPTIYVNGIPVQVQEIVREWEEGQIGVLRGVERAPDKQ